MADVTLSYKGSDILELSDSGSATLKTGGTYCEADIEVAYTKPSGGSDPYGMLLAVNNNTATSVTLDDETDIRDYLFYGCSNLTDVSFPKCVTVGSYSFYHCGFSKVTDENFPMLSDIRTRTFRGSALEYFVKPNTRVGFGGVCFEDCTSLKAVDVKSWFYQYGNQNLLFQNSSSFDTFIIRDDTAISTLTSINFFNGTPFASGKTGGTLYVPQALVSTYQNATNWSTILGYTNNQILKIEGSYYETHYADGTVIS